MSKLLGGILLVMGTCIGGGMLALPIVTAASGFLSTLVALCAFWLLSSTTGLLMLEASFYLPPGSNLITMAQSQYGRCGACVTWISYLLLLYALLSAYIAGGSDLFGAFTEGLWLGLPEYVTSIVYVLIFSTIIYTGVKAVDWVNRILMSVKLIVLLTLIGLTLPDVVTDRLTSFQPSHLAQSVMILVTSFTFAPIVPTLREYLCSDVVMLRRVIIIGSLMPLICYCAWVGIIMGTVPLPGKHGLLALLYSKHATRDLAIAIKMASGEKVVTSFFKTFSAICMLTAFLSVSLCLFDFLADGIGLKKKGRHGILITTLVFLPPTALVFFNASIYVKALNYAGLLCLLLTNLLPALIVIKKRVGDRLGANKHVPAECYIAPVNFATLGLIITTCLLLLWIGIQTM